jgi:signal transduction histidine kinase
MFFLPIISFDVLLTRGQLLILLSAIPLAYHFQDLSYQTTILIVFLILLAWFIKWRTLTLERTHRDMVNLRDSTRELTLQLEEKNKDLLDKQDYEVNLATLNERNRIAREIHDHVGHLLTRAILQAGALQAANREEQLREPLQQLKETLTESMNSIRSSLHDLHDPVINLQSEMQALVRDFTFCDIELEYDAITNPDKKIKYAFLAILREGLSNIMRHSDATHVQITMREHPALYQLIIRDNGKSAGFAESDLVSDGIGLKNMAERVRNLNGQFNVNRDQGFILFITVPKEDMQQHGGPS